MNKIDAYLHIAILIGGVVLSWISGSPWWFLAAYVVFVCMPSNVLSRRTPGGGALTMASCECPKCLGSGKIWLLPVDEKTPPKFLRCGLCQGTGAVFYADFANDAAAKP